MEDLDQSRKSVYIGLMADIEIPKGDYITEFTEKKSRFICQARGVESAEEVKGLIKELWLQHPGARHIVYAFILGDSASVFGMTDDGEPHGTAGRPMLEVLKGSGLTNALVVSIRYFGGIKLGTGGLVSAYSRSAKEALSGLKRQKKILRTPRRTTISYSLYESLKRSLEEFEVEIESEEFGTEIELDLLIPIKRLASLEETLKNLSNGQLTLKERA